MAVFLIVGFSACHITGPSVVMSVVITSVAAVLTGKRQARRAKSGKIFAKEVIIAQLPWCMPLFEDLVAVLQ